MLRHGRGLASSDALLLGALLWPDGGTERPSLMGSAHESHARATNPVLVTLLGFVFAVLRDWASGKAIDGAVNRTRLGSWLDAAIKSPCTECRELRVYLQQVRALVSNASLADSVVRRRVRELRIGDRDRFKTFDARLRHLSAQTARQAAAQRLTDAEIARLRTQVSALNSDMRVLRDSFRVITASSSDVAKRRGYYRVGLSGGTVLLHAPSSPSRDLYQPALSLGIESQFNRVLGGWLDHVSLVGAPITLRSGVWPIQPRFFDESMSRGGLLVGTPNRGKRWIGRIGAGAVHLHESRRTGSVVRVDLGLRLTDDRRSGAELTLGATRAYVPNRSAAVGTPQDALTISTAHLGLRLKFWP